MNKKSAAGSMVVEASLVVPIFFLAIVPFLYLIRISLSQAVLERTLDEALRSFAVESYVVLREDDRPALDLTGDMDVAENIQPDVTEMIEIEDDIRDAARTAGAGLEEEGQESLLMDLAGTLYLRQKVLEILSGRDLASMGIEGGEEGLSFLGSRFFYSESAHRHLLNAQMTVDWSSPFSFFDPGISTFSRTTHAFTGETDKDSNSSGLSEKEEDDDTIVYRIGQGSHYHQADCFLIDKDIITISVSEAKLMGLSPCKRCRSDLAVTGLVLMTSGGEKYHLSSCGYLYPDLQEMTLEEAVKAGLSPCGICFGSEGYFQ